MSKNYYNQIKDRLIDNEVYERVKDYSKERHRVIIYYEVGKLLAEAGKHYGEEIIKNYSNRLSKELGKGYNISNLKRMRQFYQLIEKGAPMAHQLSYSYYVELLSIKNVDEIDFYVKACIKNRWSRNE